MSRRYTSKHLKKNDSSSEGRAKRVKLDKPYYAKNRSPFRQMKAKSVHKMATKRFSQYDTSAIRPRKRLWPRLIVGVVLIALIGLFALWISSSIFGCSFNAKKDVEAGLAVEVTIPDGSSSRSIAEILYDNDVISSEADFLSVVDSLGASSSLKPGTYELVTLMDNSELVDILISGPDFYGTKLTIPEGLRLEEVASTVETTLGISSEEFLDLAYSADEYASEYTFLEGAYNNSLEGYLFPKTYDILDGSDADDVIRLMLDQFVSELSDAGLSQSGANDLTLSEIVTIASMIEKETSVQSEMATVASVIYNRLDSGQALQIDATVVYALGDSYDGEAVTYSDLEVDSPYNTYLISGLPPGPICSPGIDAMVAAANPEETSYLYYVAVGDDGTHSFFSNYEDFLAAQ